VGNLGNLKYRGDLRNTYTGNNSCRTNRSGAHTDLHCIGPGFDKVFRGISRCDVSSYNTDPRIGFLQIPNHLQNRSGMPVGGVHHKHVHPGGNE
jgi:hypothetical protein